MAPPLPERGRHPEPHVRWFPHTPLGRWGFGLMLLAAVAGPGWWMILQPSSPAADMVDDPDARIRAALTIAVVAPAVIVGAAALVRRDARSVALVVVSAVVLIEIALAAVWVVAFGNDLVGLGIVLGATVAALVGVLLARMVRDSDDAASRVP
jgi:hypothetical protein